VSPIRLSLWNAQQGYKAMADAWMQIKPLLIAGHRLHVEIKPETRSTEQNKRLWAMLNDVAEQVDWYGRKLDADSWKNVFSAALKKQEVVPSLDGKGFVVLGLRTSKMTRSEMSELQELIEAFAAERGVTLHDEVTVCQ
jgi:hypothetical protein